MLSFNFYDLPLDIRARSPTCSATRENSNFGNSLRNRITYLLVILPHN
jgi:hypothetical protein